MRANQEAYVFEKSKEKKRNSGGGSVGRGGGGERRGLERDVSG
jgi:hypothetical protein